MSRLRLLPNIEQPNACAVSPKPPSVAKIGDACCHSLDEAAHEEVGNGTCAAISKLPDESSDELVAVDVVELSCQKAARALGVPEGTLTSRLFHARDRLARRLRGGG